ncbi:MAG: hypothetical protein K8R64_07440 [Methanosarcinaceae archaeon]|nr:hypothetical protein [Methanosarcinaceae archaeon]
MRSKPPMHLGEITYYIFIELEDGTILNWNVDENPAADLDRKKSVRIAEFPESRSIGLVPVRDIGKGSFHKRHDSFVKLLNMPDDVDDVGTLNDMVSELSVRTLSTE